MKIPYIVSTLGLKNNYVSDEIFVTHSYISQYSDHSRVIIAPSTRPDRESFEKDVELLKNKYEQYMQELASNLNNFHKICFTDETWKKSFGVGLRRYIHIIYDAFKLHDNNFDINKHIFRHINKDEFVVNRNFEDCATNFISNEKGIEELFAIYIETFFPESHIENNVLNTKYHNTISKPSKIKISSIHRLKNISIQKIIRRLLTFVFYKKPQVAIIHSYFSQLYKNKLLWKSKGKIKDVTFRYPKINDTKINFSMRESLFKNFTIKDKFDEFFKKVCVFAFPVFFIEDFKINYAFYLVQAKSFAKLKYVISEGWLNDTALSFYLSILKAEYNIKHIYNEHNYLEHPYLGNRNDFICNMVDVFLTLGWKSKNTKYKPLASLFEFNQKKYHYSNKKNILYVSAASFVKHTEINSAYGENGENGEKYLQFIKTFFSKLNQDIKSQMIFRDYPPKQKWLRNSKNNSIDTKSFYMIDDFTKSAKNRMLNSRLVIIDYLATSHLESLVMNIPTIVLFNKDCYYLNGEFKDIYDELICVGIFQTEPKKACEFLANIVLDVSDWWNSNSTQKARINFLNTNIGEAKQAVNYYLSLIS